MVADVESIGRNGFQLFGDFASSDPKSIIKWGQNISEWAEILLPEKNAIRDAVDLTKFAGTCKIAGNSLAIPGIISSLSNLTTSALGGKWRKVTVDISKVGSDFCDIAKLSSSIGAKAIFNSTFGYVKNGCQVYSSLNGTWDTFWKVNADFNNTVSNSEQVAQAQSRKIWADVCELIRHVFTGIINTLSLAPLAVGVAVSSTVLTALATVTLASVTVKFFLVESAEDLSRASSLEGRVRVIEVM